MVGCKTGFSCYQRQVEQPATLTRFVLRYAGEGNIRADGATRQQNNRDVFVLQVKLALSHSSTLVNTGHILNTAISQLAQATAPFTAMDERQNDTYYTALCPWKNYILGIEWHCSKYVMTREQLSVCVCVYVDRFTDPSK